MNGEFTRQATEALQAIATNTSPTWLDVVVGIGGLVIGLGQCGLIAWGLWIMWQGNADRAAQAAYNRQQADLAEKRHTESMVALKELIERTSR